MKPWVIVVAAGSGSRFGRPKQFEFLGDSRVIDRSIAVASSVAAGVVVVTTDDQRAVVAASLDSSIRVVTGGASRSASVRAGLAAVPEDVDIVLVHDAARPLASPGLFARVVRAVEEGADAVVPGVALSDTIKRVDVQPRPSGSSTVIETIDRTALVAVQTPQGFNARALRDAHESALDLTDDAGAIEASGGKVKVVVGEPTNIKITHPSDLLIAEALVKL